MAGAGRRTFTPGEVLTASNVMNYLQDQAVQVYAGTAARGSAIGTAVSEGMVSYLADTNVVQAYDGSAWNSLAYASAVAALPTPGLIPVTAGTATSSGGTVTVNSNGLFTVTSVANISFDNVFISDPKKYRIMITNLAFSSASGADVNFRLRASGTDNTSNYYIGGYTQSGASSSNDNVTNGSQFFAGIQGTTLGYGFAEIEVYSPANTANTLYKAHLGGWTGSNRMKVLSGFHDLTNAYDGFKLVPSAAINMSFNLQIFKYKE